jgi:hypothetical protein
VYDTQTMQDDKIGEDKNQNKKDENQTKEDENQTKRTKSDFKDDNQTKKTKIRQRIQKSD